MQHSSWVLPRAGGGWVTLPGPGRQQGGTVVHPERNLGNERIESRPDEKDAFNGRDELFEQDGTKGTNSSKSWRGNVPTVLPTPF